ncbi:MAG: ABC transporter ATP-binding protein/permease [Acholeplasmataceae bacterium]|nr:ABC transporter ATP-binding protein/permease [Acholeplasmataceae bacterium]
MARKESFMSIIRLDQVAKYYKSEETVSVGMKKISLSFDLGEFVAVTGESGSGKSTLLNVISGLDGYEDGELYLFDEETSHYTIADWERYRGAYIGFVFQNYNIIDSYSVYQNVMLALEIQGYPKKDRKKRAFELIEKVGLTSHRHHKASKLSGGQKQRAVIARALAKDCPVIVADEPTGNLDSQSATQIMKLLHEISEGKLVIVVTHDYDQVKSYATRKIKMHDGEVVEDKVLHKIEHPIEAKPVELKKTSIWTLFRFAIRNLFSTPKKTLFLLIMQILVISVFTLVYTDQMKNIRERGLEQSQIFPNVPETRVLIEKRDGSEFSISEIESFRNLNHVNEIYEHSSLFYNELDLTIQGLNGYGYGYIQGTDSAISLSESEITGRIPVAIDEVVISSYWQSFNIGDTIELYNGYYYEEANQVSFGQFKVVGIDNQDRHIIYFSDAYLKQDIEIEEQLDISRYENTRSSISYQMTFDYESASVYIERAYESMDVDIMFVGNGEQTLLEDQTIEINTYSSTGIKLEKVLTGLTVIVYAEDENSYYKRVMMDQVLYDQLVEDFLLEVEFEYMLPERNMLSLSVTGYYQGNQIIEEVDSNIYKVYYPANISSPSREVLVFLSGLLAIVLLSLFGLFLYAIVHAVTRNVMNARKKDFAIYRSIGANQTSLAKLVVIEQVMMAVIGFGLTLVILNVLSSSIPMIGRTLPYMEIQDYIILILAFVLFGLWLGLRFNKKVFKQTVIETLSASKGE